MDVYVVVVESSEEAFIALADLAVEGPIELARDLDEPEAIRFANVVPDQVARP